MKVKQIVADAMQAVGRSDAAELYAADAADGETERLAYTLLFCYNAVADELARCYFPVTASEEMSSSNGKFAFSSFGHTPVKILRVTSGGKSVDWQTVPGYLCTSEKKITVEYRYAPDKAKEEDEFFYPDGAVGERIFVCGMASEYFLIGGEVESAELWENKYRNEIDRRAPLRTCATVPPRRWV